MSDVLGAVRSIVDDLRRLAADNEAARRLGPETLGLLADAGVFAMVHDVGRGGADLDYVEQLDVIEALSAADGSTGWCSMIGSDGGFVCAMLDPEVADGLYPNPHVPTVFVADPRQGIARRDGDHYVVSGTWGFASGSTHAVWFTLGTLEFDGDDLVMNGELPTIRMVVLPAADVVVHDDWDALGLRATASGTVSVKDIRVPVERSFRLGDSPPHASPNGRHPFAFFANVGAVPLGIAATAIDHTVELLGGKVPLGSFAPAIHDPQAQERVAEARGLHRSARAYYADTLGTIAAAQVAGEVDPALWAELRLALVMASRQSTRAVELCCEAAGSSAVFRGTPLDRARRDIVTVNHHTVFQPRALLGVGRTMFGLPAGLPAF